MTNQLYREFVKKFTCPTPTPRTIGIECEFPIVTHKGEAPPFSLIQRLFIHLEKAGFLLERDSFTGFYCTATKMAASPSSTAFYQDSITTDVGYSILEIVLAPQHTLYQLETRLTKILHHILPFLLKHQCYIIGYGIQPCATPGHELVMPKERYLFFKHFSYHNFIPPTKGFDSDHLAITASNQCHIKVNETEAIDAVNILNAFSGPLIAMQANSPIWNNQHTDQYKANRELLWKYAFPNLSQQLGIPPKFTSLSDYLEHLCQISTLLIPRDGTYYQVINKTNFNTYYQQKGVAIGRALNKKEIPITPQPEDLHHIVPFSWFNARLVPKYGTVESRMCCQQPPGETLTSAALTLGLIENIDAAKILMQRLSLQEWKQFRMEAIKHGMALKKSSHDMIGIIKEVLTIAYIGLLQRGQQEEQFLQPLYNRIKTLESPADIALALMHHGGMSAFLSHYAFPTPKQAEWHQYLKHSNSFLNTSLNTV
ncbi:hypothetical protein HN014_09810 [Aquimarina sp. TRL1]|uniref:glutamate-cysteine ligase family protein n=1 Tax=Aquimarina sp. (strain TRL1) TaxID=2736252 RepID=UPI001589D064|nr:glutamate-cysteine ligase family protein [Aquimarina sp. TRL1]QKX05205.1 hypothetical protein HN014_09810 [Aquimarina sp. TRL1]